jgi:diaminopimelate decarboxylase
VPLLDVIYDRLQAAGPTPALVYVEPILAEILAYFLKLTAAVPRRECLYSVKAATSPFLLRALVQHGISGFDASSASEAHFISQVLSRKVPIYVTAPALTADELALLGRIAPSCIHLDSLDAIKVALRQDPALALGIRVNPGLGYSKQPLFDAGGQRSRLGLPLANLHEALELFRQHGHTRIGLHLHVTFEASDFKHQTRAVDFLDEALTQVSLRGLTLTHLDLGGGFLPPRWDFAQDVLVPQIDADSVGPLREAIARFLQHHERSLAPDFRVLFEPGDLLVKAAAVLVARVLEHRRDLSGHEHLILDTNINHFPKLLQYKKVPVLVSPQAGGNRRVTLSGNSCLGGDHLAEIDLADASHPEYVVFADRGSYEYAKYNFFNGRYRPSVYMLDRQGALRRIKVDGIAELTAYWKEEVRPFPTPAAPATPQDEIVQGEATDQPPQPAQLRLSALAVDGRAFPAPPGLLTAWSEGMGRSAGATDHALGPAEVRKEIAAFKNALTPGAALYDPGQVAWVPSMASAIFVTLEALFGGGMRRLLCAHPTDPLFPAVASQRQIPWDAIYPAKSAELARQGPVDDRQLRPSLQEIMDAVERTPDIGAVLLSSPSLLYGRRYASEDIRQLADRAQQEGWILFIDETLDGLDFAEPPGADWRWLTPQHPVTRFGSIGKSLGRPGLPLDYLCVTAAASQRPDSGESILGRMAALAASTYGAPPAMLTPTLLTGLQILDKHRRGLQQDPDVAQHAQNLGRLRDHARWVSATLTEWNIPHVVPAAGLSLTACLDRLPRCDEDGEPFFRALRSQQGLILEPGGALLQSPDWNFTLTRIGLGHDRQTLEAALLRLCRFYDGYQTAARSAGETRRLAQK